jgi:Crp-like helix-turn-helix domain
MRRGRVSDCCGPSGRSPEPRSSPPPGRGYGSGTRIALKLTHEDLANLIGTARETVTIQLHKFEELGLIRREGRTLIVNRDRLRDYVHGKEA